jgi:transmembrane sensor
MGRKHLKFSAKRSENERSMTFLEELIVKYFDRQSENKDSSSGPSAVFNEAEVYDKILSSIKEKEAGSHNRSMVLKIAASIVLVLSIGILFYATRTDLGISFLTADLQQKEVGKGQVSMVRLEDGTKVWLNAGSKLTYPTHFDAHSRDVTLTGEAYFEVVHLDKKPFIIKSGAVKTVVLGTSFNINAYPDQQKVEVTVLTGKVAVITPEKSKSKTKTVYLTPNQKVTYKDSEQSIAPVKVVALESISWREGRLMFKSIPLEQVAKDLERTYNITLECSDKIKDCKITVNFDDDSLSDALKVMTKMIDGKLSFRDNKYYLDGQGCN